MTVFAETPLGLIATDTDGPERGNRARRDNLSPVLGLLRIYQRASDPELFHTAMANGHLDIVEYLLHRGVDVELLHRGMTPLHTAVPHGQRAVFDHLVEHGADVPATTTRRGIPAAHLIFWKPEAAETETYMLSELSRRGTDVLARDTPFPFGQTVSPPAPRRDGGQARRRPMAPPTWCGHVHAARRGGDAVAGGRAAHGVGGRAAAKRVESHDVTIEPSDGIAVPLRGLAVLGILLRRWDMYTPDEFVRLLVVLCTKGGGELRDLYTRPAMSQTALHLASCCPTLVRAGIFKYLLNRCRDTGLHVDITDGDGDTPLHYASLVGGGGWERLVSLGADPGIRNAHGMTPADLRFRGHTYQITKDPKGFPLKYLVFMGMSLPYPDRPHEVSVQSLPAEHGTPVARLWDRLAKGVVFRDVWDVEAGEKHTLSDDVGLVLRFGDRRR